MVDETVPDPRPHVVAGTHLQPGEMKTRDIVVDLVQAGHEPRDPRYLIFATEELQVGETFQDATKDEVIGQHGLNLIEERDPLRRILLALHRRLVRSATH